jgi:hypothetical protein
VFQCTRKVDREFQFLLSDETITSLGNIVELRERESQGNSVAHEKTKANLVVDSGDKLLGLGEVKG